MGEWLWLQQRQGGRQVAEKPFFELLPRSFSNKAMRRQASTRSSNAPVGRSATSTMSSATSRACSPPSSRKAQTRCFRPWYIEQIEGHDLRSTLTAFGQHLMGVYMSPTLIGIYRIAVTEANRFPDLVKSFYEQGPGRATSRLAEVLEVANKRGEIRTDDCLRLAGHFVGMIRDNLHLQVVLGLRTAPSDEEAQEAVGSAVEVFLNGVRPGRHK